MQNTLKAKLERLHQLKSSGIEFSVSVDEKELSDVEVEVLREFYREDSLAHDVAKGRDSYRTRIEPIEEKYDSLWKRIWVPRKDENFNQEVIRVLGSMNNVGEAYVNPESLTTDGRRKDIWSLDGGSLMMGGLFGLLVGVIACRMPESSGEVNAYMNPVFYTFMNAFVKSSPAIMLATPYGASKIFHNSNMKKILDYLGDATQRTDEFLRQHYV